MEQEKMKTKDKVLYGIIIVLILLLIGGGIKHTLDANAMQKEIDKGNEIIVNMDKTKKEKDGQYAKLVDYFETQKSLDKSLKESNEDLYKLLKKNNERLLQVTNIVATFEGKLDKGSLEVVNDTTFKMDIFYPDKKDWFINWTGNIFTQNHSYNGEWKFGDLKLQAVLTETERGLWNARIIGPKFLKVDSIEIKSLPPSEIVKTETKKLEFILGGGYKRSFDPTRPDAITIGGGVQWKNQSLILIDAGTDNSVGVKYLYKFKRKK